MLRRRCGLVLVCLVASCARPAIVALPSTSAVVEGDYASTATSQQGVTIEARVRGWPGEPLALGRAATPVWVRITNGGPAPLRLSRDAFELVAGTASFRALPPEQIAPDRPDVRVRELQPIELEHGDTTTGLLYFEPVVGEWPFLHLRALLVDARADALVETLDVPFGTGRRDRCPRAPRDRDEPRSGEDILFHGCLPWL